MKVLDYTGLKYVLSKITPTTGSISVTVVDAIITATDATTMKSMLMASLNTFADMSAIAKKQFVILQFQTQSGTYVGHGYYCGDGNSTYVNSKGIIQAYIHTSSGTVVDIRINNIKGTLS